MPFFRRGFATIFALLAVVAVLAAMDVYIAARYQPKALRVSHNVTATTNTNQSVTSNTNDTSTWKTYRNEAYSFEFKYPTSLSVKDIKEPAYEHEIEISGLNGLRIRVDAVTPQSIKLREVKCGEAGCFSYIPLTCEKAGAYPCAEYSYRRLAAAWGKSEVLQNEVRGIRVYFDMIFDFDTFSVSANDNLTDQALEKLVNAGTISNHHLVNVGLFNSILSTFKFIP